MTEEKTYDAWEMEQRIAAEQERRRRESRRPTPQAFDVDDFLEMLFERGYYD